MRVAGSQLLECLCCLRFSIDSVTRYKLQHFSVGRPANFSAQWAQYTFLANNTSHPRFAYQEPRWQTLLEG